MVSLCLTTLLSSYCGLLGEVFRTSVSWFALPSPYSLSWAWVPAPVLFSIGSPTWLVSVGQLESKARTKPTIHSHRRSAYMVRHQPHIHCATRLCYLVNSVTNFFLRDSTRVLRFRVSTEENFLTSVLFRYDIWISNCLDKLLMIVSLAICILVCLVHDGSLLCGILVSSFTLFLRIDPTLYHSSVDSTCSWKESGTQRPSSQPTFLSACSLSYTLAPKCITVNL